MPIYLKTGIVLTKISALAERRSIERLLRDLIRKGNMSPSQKDTKTRLWGRIRPRADDEVVTPKHESVLNVLIL